MVARGGRCAVRVKDANAPTRTGFLGIDYFDADSAWRFNARFEPHPVGQTIKTWSLMETIISVMGLALTLLLSLFL